MVDAHANFAYSVVATAPVPADSGVSLAVTTGHGSRFPAVPFNATVWPPDIQPLYDNAEIVRVTNIAGDILTIERSTEATTARAIEAGWQIAATITAKTLTDIETDLAPVVAHAASTANPHSTTAAQVGADPTGTAAAAVSAHLSAIDHASLNYIGDLSGAIQGQLMEFTGLKFNPVTFSVAHNDTTNKNAGDFLHLTAAEFALILRKTNMMSTGIVSGGIGEINADPTKFNIPGGALAVFINNYTDPVNPTASVYTKGAVTGMTATHLATAAESFVGMDSAGNIVQQATDFTDDQRRDIAVMFVLGHPDGTAIEYIINEQNYTADVMSNLHDFVRVFGSLNSEGNEFTANGANLNINKSAGKTYSLNSNYGASKKTPNIVTTNAKTAAAVQYYYRPATPGDDWNLGAYGASINPNNWDNGSGTLQSVPAGKWTIQTIFHYAPLDAEDFDVDIQYGQVVYDTQAEAEAAINNNIAINPFLKYDTFRTWLVVQQGATNLSTQASFIQAGKFGLVSITAGGGGAGGEVNTLSNAGLTGLSLVEPKVGVDLRVKSLTAGSSKITITHDDPNNSLVIDVGTLAPANITGFDESAQDAIGAMVDATLTYADATPALGRSAITGDVSIPAASNTATIQADAVTYAKMQNVSAASRLLGRGDSGSGDPQEISIGSGLQMSGTTLSATAATTPTGIFRDSQISILQSDGTLTAASGVQTWAGTNKTAQDVFTLAANSTYRIRGQYYINTGATSHSTAIAFALSGATVASMELIAKCWSAAANTIVTAPSCCHVTGVASKTLNTANTAVWTTIEFEGTLVTGTGGTVTPQINFSANPTGTNIMKRGSFVSLERIGSDVFVSAGGWA